MIELAATLFLFVLVLFGFYLLIGWFTTPFYPSRTKKLDEAFKKMNIDLKGKNFVDVGSGDGRVVLWAAKKGANSTGIEFNPFLSVFSRFLLWINGVRNNSQIYNQNFYNHDYSKYDIVYLYILKEHMDNLQDTLYAELPPGAKIISNVFKFTDVEPDEKHGRFLVYNIRDIRERSKQKSD